MSSVTLQITPAQWNYAGYATRQSIGYQAPNTVSHPGSTFGWDASQHGSISATTSDKWSGEIVRLWTSVGNDTNTGDPDSYYTVIEFSSAQSYTGRIKITDVATGKNIYCYVYRYDTYASAPYRFTSSFFAVNYSKDGFFENWVAGQTYTIKITFPGIRSGSISFDDLQTEYGGTNPISLKEYYAGQGYVDIGQTNYLNQAIPQLNVPPTKLALGDFYGATESTPIIYYRASGYVQDPNLFAKANGDYILIFTKDSGTVTLRTSLKGQTVRCLIVGGGGTVDDTSANRRGGGGGGGGAADIPNVSIPDGDYNITIGEGGKKVITSSGWDPEVGYYENAGYIPGGTTSIGSILYATGGTNGTYSGDYGRYAVAGDSGYVMYNGALYDRGQPHQGGNKGSDGVPFSGSWWGAGGGGGAGGNGVDGLVYDHNAYGGPGINSDIINGRTLSFGWGGNGSSTCSFLYGMNGTNSSYGYAGAYWQAGGPGQPNYGGGGGAGCAAGPGVGGAGILVIRGNFIAIPF
jgi:hypothetical protein